MAQPLCLLTVHAHPDDEASKGAGTVARYKDEGVRTVLVCCTGVGKPWVDFEVKTSVAQALQHRRIVLENRILAEMLRAKDINLVQ